VKPGEGNVDIWS